MNNVEEQAEKCVPDSWFGKTSPERSAQIKELTLEQFCKKPFALSSRKRPLFLSLGTDGLWRDASLERGGSGLSRGGYLMRSFGESPKDAVESTLSSILERNVPEKYYLSAKACEGILRRSERRGKELPEMLRIALEQTIARESA